MKNPIPLKVNHVSKRFGDFIAVNDVSLEIRPGEIFGLLGPNGAGKSTLINMITGLTKITTGNIEVFGYDTLRDYRYTRRLTGVMHQEVVIEKFFTMATSLKLHSGFYGVKDDPTWRNTL
ncbi:MAG: ATP-binding cassette domain-containing protein, partial [Bdellovibrionales bacterium]|nr:ATP-binding cassette domain-containing protein [Bdellovibrionales bacterium]